MDTLIRVKNYLLEHLCACCISKEKGIEEYKDSKVCFPVEVTPMSPMSPIEPSKLKLDSMEEKDICSTPINRFNLKLDHVDRQEEKVVRSPTPKKERTCFSTITIGKRETESKPKQEVPDKQTPRRQEKGYIKKTLEPKSVSMKEDDSEEELAKEISEFGDGQDGWGEWEN